MLDIEIVKKCVADYYYKTFKEEVFDMSSSGVINLAYGKDKDKNDVLVTLDTSYEAVEKYVNGKKVSTTMFFTDKAYKKFLSKMTKNKLINL